MFYPQGLRGTATIGEEDNAPCAHLELPALFQHVMMGQLAACVEAITSKHHHGSAFCARPAIVQGEHAHLVFAATCKVSGELRDSTPLH